MDSELLAILACPKCRGPLAATSNNGDNGLACAACTLVYPIRDDIPVLLVEEGISSTTWEKEGDAAKAGE